MPKVFNYSDFVGQTFNYVTVTEFLGIRQDRKQKNAYVLGRCTKCGSIKEYLLYDIRANRIRSCGCEPRCYKHGKSYTSLYRVLAAIKTRCYNEKSPPYKNYGGRGISCCKEWLYCFECFYDWSIATGYKSGLEIERINNDGNYEPTNCRWATRKEQARNKRTNRILYYYGQRKTLVEWAEETGLTTRCIQSRLRKPYWSVEQAIAFPKGTKAKLCD